MLGHLGPGAVPRVHGEEADIGQVGAHGVGVEGGDAGRPQLLQEDGLEVDQMAERAGDVHHRLAGADPAALLVALVDLDLGAALPRRRACSQSSASRGVAEHRPAHEHGVGDAAVAEPLDDRAGADEVFVGEARQIGVRG